MNEYIFGAPDSKLVLRLADSTWQLLDKDRQYFSDNVHRLLPLSGFIARLVQNDWLRSPPARTAPARAVKPATTRRLNLSKELADFVDSDNELQQALRAQGLSLSQWIMSLLNEYAGWNYTQREQLCFYDVYHRVEELLPSTPCLKLFLTGTGSRKTMRFQPLRWVNGQELPYHYLIGYDPQEQRGRAVRLSRIARVESCRGKGLTPQHREMLEKELQNTDTAFLGEPKCDIDVRMTDAGLEMLQRIVSNRPVFLFPDSDNPAFVRLHTSEKQAFIYLNRFGADAIVLNPETLRDRLRAYYERAADAYHGNSAAAIEGSQIGV